MIVAYRDYDWYMQRYEEKKVRVAQVQQLIQKYIDCGEYASAGIQAMVLVDELSRLNMIANKAAEKMS